MIVTTLQPFYRQFTILLLACAAGCGDGADRTTGRPAMNDATVSAPAAAVPAPAAQPGPDQAIATLKSRLFDDPDNVELLSALGDAYFEAGRFPQAIEIYDRAIELDPKNADCMNDRGLAYFYTGNTDSALDSIDAAIAVAPTYVHPWLSKGFMLLSLGRNAEAAEAFTRVKELDMSGDLSAEADRYLQEIAAQDDRG